MALLNAVAAVFLALCAAFFFYSSRTSERLASEYKSTPELVANVYYSQGAYDKLRDTAIDCNRFQGEMFVASLRGSAKGANDSALALLGLAALLLLNAWYLRELRRQG